MNSVRHTEAAAWFDFKREELNRNLAFAGYKLTEHSKSKSVRRSRPSARRKKRPTGFGPTWKSAAAIPMFWRLGKLEPELRLNNHETPLEGTREIRVNLYAKGIVLRRRRR